MDQPNPPMMSTEPQIQKPVKELPHLVVEEPKRGVAGTLAIVVLSLVVLAIPVGIFLVSRQTQLRPQAAVEEVRPEVVSGIFLESKLTANGVVPVDVYIKSPIDQINLVEAKLHFDPSLLSIDKIATGSAEASAPVLFNKWVESSFDNAKGEVSIIAGLPSPGLKTGSPNDEKVYLGTVNIRSKKPGTAVLQVKPESKILRNSDSENIFRTGNDLVLNLSNPVESSPSPTPGRASSEVLLVMTVPETGANYSYFKPMEIVWSAFNVETISQINLLVNGELLGPLGQNIEAKEGKFRWLPSDILALPYIQLSNTYQVEIVGVSKNGAVSKVVSGPFGILGTEEIAGGLPNPQSFAQNQLSVVDFSRALGSYLVLPLKDSSLDLNKDGVVNELDLFLIRQNLLGRGVVK